jgi:hypothetical protein
MSSPCSTTTEKRWRKYQVTPMRNGLWRAECYQEDCGWFHDLPGEEGAVTPGDRTRGSARAVVPAGPGEPDDGRGADSLAWLSDLS